MTARTLMLLSLLATGPALTPSWAASSRKKSQKKSQRSTTLPPAEPADPGAGSDGTSSSATRKAEAEPSADLPPLVEDPKPLPRPPAPISAHRPVRSKEQRAFGHAGGYFQLGYGYNWWSLDRAKVTAQVGGLDDTGNFFDLSLANAQAVSIRGGYNVLGHGHIGFHFLATGWEITNSSRGGAGYIGGEIGWHPLSLVSALLPNGPIPGGKYWDFWLEGGAGYGIVGKKRALDGGVATLGLAAEGYPLPWFSLGLRTTWYFPFFSRYILDYDRRADPGMAVELPDGSGGSFVVFNAFFALHFGTPNE